MSVTGRIVTLADGREVEVVREWSEAVRYDGALGAEVGRWTGAADRRSSLGLTAEGAWVVLPWPADFLFEPYEVVPRAAVGWFVACGLEREMPDELRGETR